MLKIILLPLFIFSCSTDLKYKDEICYDKCLSLGLYVSEDTPNKCLCAKIKDE